MTTAVDIRCPVDGLEPIGLAELLDRASLQERVDRKYLVPAAFLPVLVGGLGGVGARALDIDGRRGFRYASVYFDTADLTCYRLAAHRRPRRFKLRTRTYLDSGECWFEVKTRDVRGRTIKVRRPHDDPRPDRMDADDRAFAVAAAGDRVPGVADLAFTPALSTTYLRSTLHLPGDDSRVTVDTDLRWQLPDGAGLSRPGLVVVETKSSGRLSAADRLLWRHGLRPSSISKYATGLAALRPDLPATTWRRTLRRLAPDTDLLDRAA